MKDSEAFAKKEKSKFVAAEKAEIEPKHVTKQNSNLEGSKLDEARNEVISFSRFAAVRNL